MQTIPNSGTGCGLKVQLCGSCLAPGTQVSKGATSKNGFQSESGQPSPHRKQKQFIWTHTGRMFKITNYNKYWTLKNLTKT